MLPTEGTGAKRTPLAFAVLIPPLLFRLSLDSQGVSFLKGKIFITLIKVKEGLGYKSSGSFCLRITPLPRLALEAGPIYIVVSK